MYTRSTFGFFDFFADDDEFEDAAGAGLPVSVSWRVAGLRMPEDVRVGGIVYGIMAGTWLKGVNTTRHVTRLFCSVLLGRNPWHSGLNNFF